jgi:DNA processing protein
MTNERKEKILEKITKVNIENIKNILESKNIKIITIHSEKYPEKLKTIKQSPYLLYVRGDLREERKMLGIVGSRRSTSYGKKILEKIIPELLQAQCGIVSG